MEGRKNHCHDVIQAFQQKHPEFFRQPIIQSFLQIGKHRSLVRQAICFPTRKNKQAVDDAFQSFYGSVKALTYLSNVIHYYAINFDKTMRKRNNRETLTLDQPLQEENEDVTHKDMLYQPAPDIGDMVARETMTDYVADPQLYRGIQALSSKQQTILTQKYVHELTNKEIAATFGDSPQNVSKLHKKALQKLKNYLQKGRYGDDDS